MYSSSDPSQMYMESGWHTFAFSSTKVWTVLGRWVISIDLELNGIPDNVAFWIAGLFDGQPILSMFSALKFLKKYIHDY